MIGQSDYYIENLGVTASLSVGACMDNHKCLFLVRQNHTSQRGHLWHQSLWPLKTSLRALFSYW